MAPAPTSSSGALILEEPLIRTPYELLRRSHRSAQRQVEKDFNAVQSALQGILKSLNGSEKTEEGRNIIIAKLDQASDRAQGLKRKLDDIQPSADQPTPLRSRLNYLYKVDPTPITPAAANEVKDNVDTDAEKGMEVDGEAEVAPPPAPEPKFGYGMDSTLDRYIVDYLLRTGRMKAAKALAERQGIEPLVDIKLFAELTKIEIALVEKHSCAEALAWCGENRGTLKKTKNSLEFTLRLQEFIELCRKRDIPAAIAYSRKNMAGWAGTHMTELQQGMTLLAFGEKTGVGLYRKLYDQSRWENVRAQFRETFLNLYAQPSQSVLSLSLSAGLASLRLPSCVPHQRSRSFTWSATDGWKATSETTPAVPLLPAAPPLHNLESLLSTSAPSTSTAESQPQQRTIRLSDPPPAPQERLWGNPDAHTGNVDCPTCGEGMRVLASEVPMSHHVNSTIVCRISGEVMDSQNEPMAFPNGYVYSSKALKEMAKNNFDVVKCPRTGESCAFSRLRKVYIS
ncbi:hypothetical protein CI109_101742 [Kwoniella shandongensis]|uniref:Uncharacterized protein n=1 Tax=Kwoniella shandongensis TaxID=1734106 RepID=A0A5M6C5F3_9TREE|nr:uncharacterized protein CI109_001135 [Kwoniella shandongensis]KAA5530334.1 hypothetical protein CI109_001135 [Kwoniella shandongensis]